MRERGRKTEAVRVGQQNCSWVTIVDMQRKIERDRERQRGRETEGEEGGEKGVERKGERERGREGAWVRRRGQR